MRTFVLIKGRSHAFDKYRPGYKYTESLVHPKYSYVMAETPIKAIQLFKRKRDINGKIVFPNFSDQLETSEWEVIEVPNRWPDKPLVQAELPFESFKQYFSKSAKK
jgi:hypothetical protein